MITFQESVHEIMSDQTAIIFIHTPLCGTCKLARTMLETIEITLDKNIFYDMNGSIYPQFLQDHKVESIPCLMIIVNGEVERKIYAFQSVPYLYDLLKAYIHVGK
ncbi:thioredoxin family protein [Aquibacillus sp. 3ASR75-11]|uniref:Thioredoxin family protein n=1 Tax=Terrihalobacillus insolitus TaxID=2950438 RepID=A0A9X3WPU2_9BACI|nr:thioredoxin family protein [Terrihalobacillus insolitus]MDC3412337.1 thioredoxin family protein [Terrihalobacillus insolitus]MDC3422970.1 thioredoxin family protein [Terrihalobacillus insolitus]